MGFLARIVRDGRRAPRAFGATSFAFAHGVASALPPSMASAAGTTVLPELGTAREVSASDPVAFNASVNARATDRAEGRAISSVPEMTKQSHSQFEPMVGKSTTLGWAVTHEPSERRERTDKASRQSGRSQSTPVQAPASGEQLRSASGQRPNAMPPRIVAGSVVHEVMDPFQAHPLPTVRQDDAATTFAAPELPTASAGEVIARRGVDASRDHAAVANPQQTSAAPAASLDRARDPVAVAVAERARTQAGSAPAKSASAPELDSPPKVHIDRVDVFVEGGGARPTAKRAAPIADESSQFYLRGT